MQIGDKVKGIGFFKDIEGIVTEIIPGHDIEDHGMITIVKPDGELEHFVYYAWQKH